MRHRFIVFLLLLALVSGCRTARTVRPIEYPEVLGADDLVVHEGFAAVYNHETLCPDWVAYELTAAETEGRFKGRQSFQWDPDLTGRQANREDYRNDRHYDKGHMAPKADMKWSVKAYEESYYLSNICPQNHTFNGGIWLSTEKLARRVAAEYGRVYIVCGPIFTDHAYGYLGESQVAIPDRFFKALLIPKGDAYSAIAFVLDNCPANFPLKSSAMTVDTLEHLLGRDLFQSLDDSQERKAESTVVYGDWSL